MEKKQTAVEWLYEQIKFIDKDTYNELELKFQQAKEMEKEQIKFAQMDMFLQACEQPYGITYLFSRDNAEEWAEQYYYETYHSSKQ